MSARRELVVKMAGAMKAKDAVEELAKGRLLPLIVRYSWPALVAMSLNALYSVVDRLYIGRGCGEAAMAGLTLTFPVMMLFAAFGVFIGAGHAALISIRLGADDRDGCERILGELVAMKFLFFFILPPLIFFNLDTVLNWCGGAKVSAEAFDCARRYLRLVIFSHIFSHLAFGLSATMRSEGSAVRSMMCMVVGFGTNLLLDPLLIFGIRLGPLAIPAMGISGAAWATNIAMAASCLFAFHHYWSGRSVVRLRLSRVRIWRDLVGRTSAIGFAPFLQQLLGAAINVSLAAAFAKWAADERSATTQIASLGVFQSVFILVMMPILGVQQGIQPILGYNWGARNYRRVRSALLLGFWVTSVLCVLGCLVQVVPPLPAWFAQFFVSSDNPGLLKIAAGDLQISNCMLWCIGLNVIATTYFQSIGHPGTAVILSTLRQGVCLLPVIWILPYFMADHEMAIWLAMPVSDVLCCLMTIVPFILNLRFLSRVRERELLETDG